MSVALPHDASAAGVARRALRETLSGRQQQRVVDDLALVVSELVTNAVVHGQAPIRLWLLVEGGDVRGEVIDGGSGFEHEVREAGPSATSGRGLLIVDRLTTRWGVREGTTHVWFEMLAGEQALPL